LEHHNSPNPQNNLLFEDVERTFPLQIISLSAQMDFCIYAAFLETLMLENVTKHSYEVKPL